MTKKSTVKKCILFVVAGLYVAFSLVVAVTHMDRENYTKLPNAEPVPPASSEWNGGCVLDFCNGVWIANDSALLKETISADTGGSYVISGWAVDIGRLTPLYGVYVKAGDKVLRCDYGEQRADVAQVFEKDECASSGFSVEIPAEMIKQSDGTFVSEISFYLLSSDTKYLYGPITYYL